MLSTGSPEAREVQFISRRTPPPDTGSLKVIPGPGCCPLPPYHPPFHTSGWAEERLDIGETSLEIGLTICSLFVLLLARLFPGHFKANAQFH